MITLKQNPYSGLIKAQVNRAFSEVEFVFETDKGEPATVILDMESSLDVMYQMDDGKPVVYEMGKMKQARTRRPWWRFW